MILITLNHTGGSFNVGRLPLRVVTGPLRGSLCDGCKIALSVWEIVQEGFWIHRGGAEPVALQVGFVYYIQPVFVTQVQKPRVVGIVRSPNRIDVMLLH